MAKTKPVITCDKCNKEILDYWLVTCIDRVIDWPEMHFCQPECMIDYLNEWRVREEKRKNEMV